MRKNKLSLLYMKQLPEKGKRLLLSLHGGVLTLSLLVAVTGGCREQTNTSPIVDSKLAKLYLTSQDLKILLQPPGKTLLPPVATALSYPLNLPDLIQKTSEAWLIQNETHLSANPSFFAPALGISQVKKVRLDHAPIEKALIQLMGRTQQNQEKTNLYLEKIREAPPCVSQMLAVLLEAAIEANESLKKAYARLTPKEEDALRQYLLSLPSHIVGDENANEMPQDMLVLAEKINTPQLYQAFMFLTQGVEQAREILESVPDPVVIPESIRLETPQGPLILGSSAEDSYTEPPFLLLDFSGDDHYQFSSSPALSGRTQLILDFSGNDSYQSQTAGTLACGLLGVAILADFDGHDYYNAKDLALGAGLCGVGVLVDEGGDDEYRMHSFGMGAGFFGLGILYDKEGNDYYFGKHYCEGLGMPLGLGLLLDVAGNDFYSAGGQYQGWAYSEKSYKSSSQGFGMGFRGFAPGGLGILIDGTGNDAYHGAALCQGSGYWYGLGVLHDLMGDDVYSSVHYAQGSGVHFGAGCLLDNEGHDFYKTVAAGQGLGYHRGLGILVDYRGDDHYQAKKLAGGAASLSGIGILDDKAGNDSYQLGLEGTDSLGIGTQDKGIDSIGLFFDEGGEDFYAHSQHFQNADETTLFRGLRSDGVTPLDIFSYQSLYVPKADHAKPKTPIALLATEREIPEDPETLFHILTDADTTPAAREQAHAAFLKLNRKAVDFLLASLQSNALMKASYFPEQYIPVFEDQVLPRLQVLITKEKNDLRKARYIAALGYLKNKTRALGPLRKLSKKRLGIASRTTTLSLLASYPDEASAELFRRNLRQKNSGLLMAGLEGVGNLRDKAALPELAMLLDHPYYVVRDQAAETLEKLGDDAMEYLRKEYPNASAMKKQIIDRVFDHYRAHAR